MALGLRDNFKGASGCDERARVASALANIGKMWCSAQDAKREILGKPKAGVFKPERPKPKRPREREPVESALQGTEPDANGITERCG